MVVGIFKLVPLIGNRRVENMFYIIGDQPLYMSVSQFCRIALGFAGNGFDAQLINLPGRRWGENHPEAQFRENVNQNG